MGKLKKRIRRGFTLVELVVVIAIIAILASVSVAGYFGYTGNAKKSVLNQEATTVADHYTMWHISEHSAKKDLFENLDAFREYLVGEELNENPTGKKTINYYVEAADESVPYDVTMFYTASNGYVKTFKLETSDAGLTGKITAGTENYKSLDAALASMSVVNNPDLKLTSEALQYDWDSVNKKAQVRYDYFNLFDSKGKTLFPDDNYKPYDASVYQSLSDADFAYYSTPEGKKEFEDSIDLANNGIFGIIYGGLFKNYDEMNLKIDINTNVFKDFADLDDAADGFATVELKAALPAIASLSQNESLNGTIRNQYLNLIYWRLGSKFPIQSKNKIKSKAVVYKTENGDSKNVIEGPGLITIKNENMNSLALVNNYGTAANTPNGKILVQYEEPIEGEAEPMTLDKALNYGTANNTDTYVLPSFGTTSTGATAMTIKESTTVPTGRKLILKSEETYDAKPTLNKNGVHSDKNLTPSYKVVIGNNSVLTIGGEMHIDATMNFGSPYSAFLSDKNYVELVIESGSKVIIEDGGVLNCYGKISGDGEIVVKSGGKLLEPLQILDFKGGANTTTTIEKGIFPFNKYDVSNISAKVNMEQGANYNMYTFAFMSGIGVSLDVNFIGENGLFKLGAGGKVTKTIDPVSKALTLDVEGKLDEQPTVISASGIPAISTDRIPFPFYNVNLNIKEGSTVTLQTMQLKVLPSSSITVDQNATLIIGEKAKVSVYDTFTAYDSLENAYFNSSFVGIDAAQMTVNGNLVVNGALGGKVDSTSQGKVTVGSAASLYVQFPEGAKLGSTASFQNLTQPALNLSLPGIVTVEKSSTYNYNSIDNVWIKG